VYGSVIRKYYVRMMMVSLHFYTDVIVFTFMCLGLPALGATRYMFYINRYFRSSRLDAYGVFTK